jgi:hypothetical protein
MKIKQDITKEQWDELDEKEKVFFIKETPSFKLVKSELFEYPNIGQMIEFLGHNWDYNFMDWSDHAHSLTLPPYDVFCDHLWNACKNKLGCKDKEEPNIF